MHASSCRCCLLPTGQTVLLLTLRKVATHPASFVVVVGVVFCLLNKTVLWLRFQSCCCLQSYHACCCCCLLPIGQNRSVAEVSVLLLSAVVSCFVVVVAIVVLYYSSLQYLSTTEETSRPPPSKTDNSDPIVRERSVTAACLTVTRQVVFGSS